MKMHTNTQWMRAVHSCKSFFFRYVRCACLGVRVCVSAVRERQCTECELSIHRAHNMIHPIQYCLQHYSNKKNPHHRVTAPDRDSNSSLSECHTGHETLLYKRIIKTEPQGATGSYSCDIRGISVIHHIIHLHTQSAAHTGLDDDQPHQTQEKHLRNSPYSIYTAVLQMTSREPSTATTSGGPVNRKLTPARTAQNVHSLQR